MASTVLEFPGIKYEERIRLTSLSYRWENGGSVSGAAQPSSHHEAAEPGMWVQEAGCHSPQRQQSFHSPRSVT